MRAGPCALTSEILEAWAGRPASDRRSRRCLDLTQLAALRESGLVEIGAHTVHHPRLSKLGRAARLAEIVQSRDRLAELVNDFKEKITAMGELDWPGRENKPGSTSTSSRANA